MRISKASLRAFLLVAMTLIILSLRPALPGQALNEAILLVPLAGLAVLYVFLGFGLSVSNARIALLIVSVIFVGYLILNTLVLAPGTIRETLQIAATLLLVATVTLFLFQLQDVNNVFRVIFFIFFFLALSQTVTYTLMFLTRSPESLLWGTLLSPTDAQPWSIRLYFPFTPTAGYEFVAGTFYPRATGIYREPGIYQAFVTMSFFAVDFFPFRRKLLMRLVLLFSLFTVFSTAGYIVFLITLSYKYILNIKKIRTFLYAGVAVSITVIGLMFLWDAGLMGIRYKLFTQGARLPQTIAVIAALKQSPFWGIGRIESVGGINFIAALSIIGLFGGALFVVLVVYALSVNYTKRNLIPFLPLLFTLVFAQPLYNKGIVFFMLLLCVKGLQIHGVSGQPDVENSFFRKLRGRQAYLRLRLIGN